MESFKKNKYISDLKIKKRKKDNLHCGRTKTLVEL